MNFETINAAIPLPDEVAMAKARARWDRVAKPLGSLGLLESAIVSIAGIQKTADVAIEKRGVLVFSADNGVTKQGVAMTPPAITCRMTECIAAHRSAVCIMADCAHADVFPVDMGMFERAHTAPGTLLDRRIAAGTQDFTSGPAMTRAEAERAIETGMQLVKLRKSEGYRLLATGEMGIGNTTTSSAIASVLLKKTPEAVTGRGVGLDDAGLSRKVAAIRQGIAVNAPNAADPLDVLTKLGGFDIAAMAGAFLGGGQYGVPVLIDGFISAVAALVAVRLCPRVRPYLLPSHVSAEPAGEAVLTALKLSAPLHAAMRLGEGTGAVATIPLLDMAVSVYNRAATYADIGM